MAKTIKLKEPAVELDLLDAADAAAEVVQEPSIECSILLAADSIAKSMVTPYGTVTHITSVAIPAGYFEYLIGNGHKIVKVK